MVLAVFIIASLICLFLYQDALGKMADNSKEKVIKSTVSIISSSHNFVARMIMFLHVMEGEATSYGQIEQGLQLALAEGRETSTQKYVNDMLKEMIDSDFLDQKTKAQSTVAELFRQALHLSFNTHIPALQICGQMHARQLAGRPARPQKAADRRCSDAQPNHRHERQGHTGTQPPPAQGREVGAQLQGADAGQESQRRIKHFIPDAAI